MIADLIKSKMEDLTVPNGILEVLKTLDGKKLTVRHLSLLREVDESICIVKNWGTYIKWGQHDLGLQMKVSDAETGVVIDVDHISRNLNARWFEAAPARNERRKRLLANKLLISMLETKINEVNKSKREFDNLLEEVYIDKFTIEGLIEGFK